MKRVYFLSTLYSLAILTTASKSLAASNTVKCPITSDSALSNVNPKNHLILSYHQTGADRYWIDSVQYVEVDLNSGGEQTKSWYSQENRAGYNVTYCNPNTNEYISSIEKFNLHSICVGEARGQGILFQASLSKRKEGEISFRVTHRLRGFDLRCPNSGSSAA